MSSFLGFFWHWESVPAIAAILVGAGVIYTKAVRPVVLGIQYLVEIGEYLQRELSGADGSVKSKLDDLATQVEGMDSTWSKWIVSHTREHADIWAILAKLGFDRRYYREVERPPGSMARSDDDHRNPREY